MGLYGTLGDFAPPDRIEFGLELELKLKLIKIKIKGELKLDLKFALNCV